MAGKKNIDEVNEEVVVETTPEVKPEKVPYMIPLSPDPKDDKFVYAALNGKGYKIKKGVTVMIPLALKEILDNANEQQRKAIEEAERLQNKLLEQARKINAV